MNGYLDCIDGVIVVWRIDACAWKIESMDVDRDCYTFRFVVASVFIIQ